MQIMAYEVYLPTFVCFEILTKEPSVLPISSRTCSSQNFVGSEYNLIQIGAIVRSSVSGLKSSFHGLRNRPAELRKYEPPSKIIFLSSIFKKITVKKPLDPNCKSQCPFGFQTALIQVIKDFSDGQRPINFLIRAWSVI